MGLRRKVSPPRKSWALGSDVAALGALEATRRLARGETPYLDHLPPLDLWAVQPDGSRDWSKLIEADKAVEAGRTYRTQSPSKFTLEARTRTIEFRLRKGNDIRVKNVELKDLPTTNHPVQVYAEQRPASGHATCSVTSESYEPLKRRPIRLTWRDLDEDTNGFESTPVSLAPDLVEYETHSAYWKGPQSAEYGLDEFLSARKTGSGRHVVQARNLLYRRLSAIRPPGGKVDSGRKYAVSSSGELPDADELGEANLARIESKLDAALEALNEDLDEYVNQPARESLRVTNRRHLPATWCFVRCPESIQDHLIEGVEIAAGKPPNWRDPLKVTESYGAVSVYHGLGRTVSGR